MKKIVHSKFGGTPIKILWTGFRPMFDYWGNELKRFYQFDTLVNSLNTYLEIKDKHIIPTIQKILGNSSITSLKFHLFQEGKYQFIFRLLAENQKMKRTFFAFVIAKDGDELSKVAKTEHHLLITLHKRCPDKVVKPFTGDYLFFPDRYQRKAFHRKIYAYLTQWLPDYDELGINKDLQFFTNVEKPHTFSIKETNQIKAGIIDTIVSLYDEQKKVSIALPEIASGDFVIKRSPSGNHKLKLIACRKTIQNIKPHELIAKIINTSWQWGNKKFHLLPDEPCELVDTFIRSIGEERAILWFSNLWSVEKKLLKHPVVPYGYIEQLRKITASKLKRK